MPIFRNEEGRNVDSKLTCGYESSDAKIIIVGTPIAIDSYAPKVNRYIILGSEPNLIGHNSHLLVVVYAPEEVEVNYLIWSAETETKVIEKV